MRRALSIAIAAAALAAGGCGSGEGGQAIAREEFTAAAARVCAQADRAAAPLRAAYQAALEDGRLLAAADRAERLVELAGQSASSLRALEPVATDQETFEEMLAAFERMVEQGSGLPAAIRAGDRAWLEAHGAKVEEQHAAATAAASALGLEQCVEGD